jgi:hypothetical protein
MSHLLILPPRRPWRWHGRLGCTRTPRRCARPRMGGAGTTTPTTTHALGSVTHARPSTPSGRVRTRSLRRHIMLRPIDDVHDADRLGAPAFLRDDRWLTELRLRVLQGRRPRAGARASTSRCRAPRCRCLSTSTTRAGRGWCAARHPIRARRAPPCSRSRRCKRRQPRGPGRPRPSAPPSSGRASASRWVAGLY